MSYNTFIPQLTDPTLQSNGQLRANYEAISSVFAVNHNNLVTSSPTIQGQHRVLTMRPQNSDPDTSATQIAFYNKLVSSPAADTPALFFRPSNNQTPIQLTYSAIQTGVQSVGPPITYFAQQYSFVAGPFVIYMGKINNSTPGQLITLSPSTNLLYVGTSTTGVSSTTTQDVMTIPTNINSTKSTFNIQFQTGLQFPTLNFYYLAIGQ